MSGAPIINSMIKYKHEHKHKLLESNRLHQRAVNYCNVFCEECGERFEHVLWYGVMNRITREVNELHPKTLPDEDYDDGTFPK